MIRVVETSYEIFWNPNSPLARSPLLKDEPASGLDFRGIFKGAPDIRINGPAAGGGYVLRPGRKVKVAGKGWAPGDKPTPVESSSSFLPYTADRMALQLRPPECERQNRP